MTWRRQAWAFALIVLASTASAQTRWPDLASTILPGPSYSPVAAVIWDSATVETPGSDVPRPRASWSGRWEGWACRDAVCDTKLVVERVTAQDATIIYAFASQDEAPRTTRLQARFVGDELQATLPGGERLAYRMRSNDVIEFLRVKDIHWTVVGVLARQAGSGSVRGSVTRLPLTIDGETVSMEFRVYRPGADGPFPTLVFNHGSTGFGRDPSLFRRPAMFPTVAEFFGRRGYAVVMPSRRGRGNSDGVYDEGFDRDRSKGYSCDPPLSLPGAERALRDIDAAMGAVAAMPFVDRSRILIGGESRGGILSVAYAGMRPDRVIGVVNFVGGWMTDRCPGGPIMNRQLFVGGARFRGPTIWLYGDKDPFYPLSHSRENFTAFVSAGGRAAFHEFQPVEGMDGHRIVFRQKLWEATMEDWLKSAGLPAQPR